MTTTTTTTTTTYLYESNGGWLYLAQGTSVDREEGWAVVVPAEVYASACFRVDAGCIARAPAPMEQVSEFLAREGWLGFEVVPWREVEDMDCVAAFDPDHPTDLFVAWADDLVHEAGHDYSHDSLRAAGGAARDYLGLKTTGG